MPATLSLTLGAPATFGAVPAGRGKDYSASTTATVTSTAGDATLTSRRAIPGHLTNGAFSLPEALQVDVLEVHAGTGRRPTTPSTITFRQHIGANDALRTGAYAKTLTFTLSTTNPVDAVVVIAAAAALSGLRRRRVRARRWPGRRPGRRAA